jgi:hypothetical protein
MICARVPRLLKRNVGVLFGALRDLHSDAPPFLDINYKLQTE